jgi:hypothetical protein
MGVSGHLHAPAFITNGKGAPNAHCIEGWVGLKASVDTVAKFKYSNRENA